MKKIISILLVVALSVSLVGCGGKKEDPVKETQKQNVEQKQKPKKEYEPKEVAEYNMIYRDTMNKEKNGQYPVINITKVEKKDGNVVVSIGAPTYTQIGYAFDEFLFVRPLDVNGKELNLDKLNLNPIGTDAVEAELIITGVDAEKTIWLEIGPYKTANGNPVVFKVE